MSRSKWSDKYRVAGRWALKTGYHNDRPREARSREKGEEAARSSINRIILLGELSSEPILCYTASGKAYCYLTLTTSESWLDFKGDRRERVDHHLVLTLSKDAELSASLCKGSTLWIEGKLTTRFEVEAGKKHFRAEIQAQKLTVLSLPKEPRYDYIESDDLSFSRRILG